MTVDMSQFHEVFFEESFEGLDIMENGLLELQPGQLDNETVNAIFRAAHSIKGGAGTFGFMMVSDFTHHLETLLDQIRDGSRCMRQSHVDCFLEAVDCLRDLLQTLQAKNEPDMSSADLLVKQFEAMLAEDPKASDDPAASAEVPALEPAVTTPSAAVESSAVAEDAAEAKPKAWSIYFKPEPYILRTGNEPLRMIRELADLGTLTVNCEVGEIPTFGELSCEECFMAWNIELNCDDPTTVEEATLREIFEWVEDDAQIDISPLTQHSGEVSAIAVAGLEESTLESKVEEGERLEQIMAGLSADTLAVAAPEAKTTAQKKPAEATSIRVGTDKVDSLINLVGELVITQSMLGQLGSEFEMDKLTSLQTGLAQLEHNTRELQENVMRIRMLPISFSFNRFPRLLRDLSRQLNKQVKLVLQGEQTELDKTVMEKIGDPMVHLVRNAIDHGIETPEARIAAGKDPEGTITLNAFHQGGNIIIEITDDGAGLNPERILAKAISKGLVAEGQNLSNEEINDLVFQPGFSTAEVVSDVSGRGVGMDVVRRNIQELSGTVAVTSTPGKGSVFRIRLPLTLAILDGQLVSIGEETYIFPLVSIVESMRMDTQKVNQIAGGSLVFKLRDEYVPIIKLHEVYEIEPLSTQLEESLLVVVESDIGSVGIVVDDLLAQQQVVIKSLESNYQRIEGVSGATILGDGRVALIVDIQGVVKLAGVDKSTMRKLHPTEAA